MKRPTGVTVIALLTFFGAAILALASLAFFVVAVLGMTGGEAREPVSVALAGMGVAGGFSLVILAGVAACLAIGVLKLREWARLTSIASIAAAMGCTVLSLFALRGYVVIPVVPSIVCHLLVMTTAVWMAEYLSRPRVKQAFNALTTDLCNRPRQSSISLDRADYGNATRPSRAVRQNWGIDFRIGDAAKD